jgi:hypothetical protein
VNIFTEMAVRSDMPIVVTAEDMINNGGTVRCGNTKFADIYQKPQPDGVYL